MEEIPNYARQELEMLALQASLYTWPVVNRKGEIIIAKSTQIHELLESMNEELGRREVEGE